MGMISCISIEVGKSVLRPFALGNIASSELGWGISTLAKIARLPNRPTADRDYNSTSITPQNGDGPSRVSTNLDSLNRHVIGEKKNKLR